MAAIGFRLSAIGFRLSAFGYQPSGMASLATAAVRALGLLADSR
jgi:hypothetical protein